MEIYRGYEIKENDFGMQKHPESLFIFRNLNDCDESSGSGKSLKDCKTQINEILNERWNNPDRTRYYGKRKGDIINAISPCGVNWGKSEVLDYVPGDNNRLIIKSKNGTPIDWVAEYCEIVTKVEDRSENQNSF